MLSTVMTHINAFLLATAQMEKQEYEQGMEVSNIIIS